MMLAMPGALALSERLAALALLQQTVELWQLRRCCGDQGIWRVALLGPELSSLPSPLRQLFQALAPYAVYRAHLLARFIGASLLLLGAPAVLPCLLLSQVALCVRFRGTFNGGSDYMTVVVLLGLSLSSVFSGSPFAARAGLGYIAIQLTLSYFVSGLAKIRVPAWRNGTALRHFIEDDRYAAPATVREWLRRPSLARLASWAVLLFECGFPIAWLGPSATTAFGAAGLAFHLGTSIVFGLNRFLFIWAAAYPALFYFSQSG